MARLEGPLDMIDRPISGGIFVIILLVLISHFIVLYKEHKALRKTTK